MVKLVTYRMWATENMVGIESLFIPGRSVYQQTRDLGATHYQMARARAPMGGTGDLKAKHYINLTPRGNLYWQYSVGSNSNHAEAVFFGTKDVEPIRSKKYSARNRWMNRRGYPYWVHKQRGRSVWGFLVIDPFPRSDYGVHWMRPRVQGQYANPWLTDVLPAAIAKWKASQRFELRNMGR